MAVDVLGQRRSGVLVLTCVLLVCLGWSRPGALEAETPSQEQQVKALAIWRLAQFVEWPARAFEAADAPQVLTILGDAGPLAAAIELIEGKPVGGRALVIRHAEGIEELGTCHVLVVGSLEGVELPEILKALERSSILTIGEAKEFSEMGGMIELVATTNKLRFDINRGAVERAGLRISAEVLQLAREVKE